MCLPVPLLPSTAVWSGIGLASDHFVKLCWTTKMYLLFFLRRQALPIYPWAMVCQLGCSSKVFLLVQQVWSIKNGALSTVLVSTMGHDYPICFHHSLCSVLCLGDEVWINTDSKSTRRYVISPASTPRSFMVDTPLDS